MGIAAWIVAGLLVGLAGWKVRWPGAPGGCFGSFALALLGALAGGALATWLRFGGLLAFDGRGAVTALLGAILAVLLGGSRDRPAARSAA
jgi:uncharacterized membrane protein YeaQ/YmgE (transglycosylase-associated protein family)